MSISSSRRREPDVKKDSLASPHLTPSSLAFHFLSSFLVYVGMMDFIFHSHVMGRKRHEGSYSGCLMSFWGI